MSISQAGHADTYHQDPIAARCRNKRQLVTVIPLFEILRPKSVLVHDLVTPPFGILLACKK